MRLQHSEKALEESEAWLTDVKKELKDKNNKEREAQDAKEREEREKEN